MKVLNLYAGLGGNRHLWQDVEVTAVESRKEIADQYRRLYPDDIVIVGDAHEWLEGNYADYDFIWSSPPCQSHSRSSVKGNNMTPRYPDMKLWQEIIFLMTHCKKSWCVENVQSYYRPWFQPQRIGRHCFWSNFWIVAEPIETPIFNTDRQGLEEWLGFGYEGNIYYDGNHDPLQILRNCVHPELGNAVLESCRGLEVRHAQPALFRDAELPLPDNSNLT